MLAKQLENLNEKERIELLGALPVITVLIAGADGKIDEKEIEWAEEATKIRSYTYSDSLKDFYKLENDNLQKGIAKVIESTSFDREERNKDLSQRLNNLSPILYKLDIDFAITLLDSWRSFAKHLAESTGGFLDYESIGIAEYKLVDLPMIEFDPKNNNHGI